MFGDINKDLLSLVSLSFTTNHTQDYHYEYNNVNVDMSIYDKMSTVNLVYAGINIIRLNPIHTHTQTLTFKNLSYISWVLSKRVLVIEHNTYTNPLRHTHTLKEYMSCIYGTLLFSTYTLNQREGIYFDIDTHIRVLDNNTIELSCMALTNLVYSINSDIWQDTVFVVEQDTLHIHTNIPCIDLDIPYTEYIHTYTYEDITSTCLVVENTHTHTLQFDLDISSIDVGVLVKSVCPYTSMFIDTVRYFKDSIRSIIVDIYISVVSEYIDLFSSSSTDIDLPFYTYTYLNSSDSIDITRRIVYYVYVFISSIDSIPLLDKYVDMNTYTLDTFMLFIDNCLSSPTHTHYILNYTHIHYILRIYLCLHITVNN